MRLMLPNVDDEKYSSPHLFDMSWHRPDICYSDWPSREVRKFSSKNSYYLFHSSEAEANNKTIWQALKLIKSNEGRSNSYCKQTQRENNSPQLSAADTAILHWNKKNIKRIKFPGRLWWVKTTFQSKQEIKCRESHPQTSKTAIFKVSYIDKTEKWQRSYQKWFLVTNVDQSKVITRSITTFLQKFSIRTIADLSPKQYDKSKELQNLQSWHTKAAVKCISTVINSKAGILKLKNSDKN